jgi:hypothetical protein
VLVCVADSVILMYVCMSTCMQTDPHQRNGRAICARQACPRARLFILVEIATGMAADYATLAGQIKLM